MARRLIVVSVIVSLFTLMPMPALNASALFAIAKVSSVSAGASGGGTFTTGNISTTGASLFVACVSSYIGASAPTLSDSQTNTWTGLTARNEAVAVRNRMFYVASPSTSGTHNFTLTGSGTFGGLAVYAFSGTDTSSPFDSQQAGATGNSTSSAPGSITPAQNDSVVVSCATLDANISSVGASMTLDENVAFSGGNHYAAAGAYIVQTTATAINPTWSWTGTQRYAMSIASFKPAGGSPTFPGAIINGLIRGGGVR